MRAVCWAVDESWAGELWGRCMRLPGDGRGSSSVPGKNKNNSGIQGPGFRLLGLKDYSMYASKDWGPARDPPPCLERQKTFRV